jgi:hypothetical protein
VIHGTSHDSVVHAAGLGELLWRAPDGPPRALGVVPLLMGDRPAVALPWARVEDARAAAASPQAALVLSDPRLTASAWRPLALTGRLTLVEDGDGDLFAADLLRQEVRKHPPSRALVDSAVLRRENWWYLARLVLLLDPVSVEPVEPRESPQHAVLGVDDDGLEVRTVTVGDWSADPLPLSGGPLTATGPAVLVGQEVSVPDAERWTVHVTTGRYADGRLTGVVPAAGRDLEPVPGLLTRVRRQRALERACVAALRRAGHG